jgi:hypothetical protein
MYKKPWVSLCSVGGRVDMIGNSSHSAKTGSAYDNLQEHTFKNPTDSFKIFI